MHIVDVHGGDTVYHNNGSPLRAAIMVSCRSRVGTPAAEVLRASKLFPSKLTRHAGVRTYCTTAYNACDRRVIALHCEANELARCIHCICISQPVVEVTRPKAATPPRTWFVQSRSPGGANVRSHTHESAHTPAHDRFSRFAVHRCTQTTEHATRVAVGRIYMRCI